jgi:hypothetical protein
MREPKDGDGFIVSTILIIIAFTCGFILSHNLSKKRYEKQIEERGYAEYFINEEKQVEWRWKE